VGDRTYPSKSSVSVVAPSPLRETPLRVRDWLAPPVVSLRTVTPAFARPFLSNLSSPPHLLRSPSTRSTPTHVLCVLIEYMEDAAFHLEIDRITFAPSKWPFNDTQHSMLGPGTGGGWLVLYGLAGLGLAGLLHSVLAARECLNQRCLV
jgi:hypothetical protein